MKIARADAVAVLHFCGYKGMDAKSDSELSQKVAIVPEILGDESPDERIGALIAEITETVKVGGKFEVYSPEPEKSAAVPVTDAPAAFALVSDEAVSEKPKRIRRTKEQIAADEAAGVEEKAAKKAAREAEKAAAKADKPVKEKKPKKEKVQKDVMQDARARRGKKSSAYIGGEMLRELGIEGGITPEKMARYRVLRGDAVGKLDKWYLTTAWNAICGYLGDFPAKSSENAAPVAVHEAQATAAS